MISDSLKIQIDSLKCEIIGIQQEQQQMEGQYYLKLIQENQFYFAQQVKILLSIMDIDDQLNLNTIKEIGIILHQLNKSLELVINIQLDPHKTTKINLFIQELFNLYLHNKYIKRFSLEIIKNSKNGFSYFVNIFPKSISYYKKFRDELANRKQFKCQKIVLTDETQFQDPENQNQMKNLLQEFFKQGQKQLIQININDQYNKLLVYQFDIQMLNDFFENIVFDLENISELEFLILKISSQFSQVPSTRKIY
ncbi:hypothetical protein PPERSA_03115 [Pseudocohnilembus persalinus]|uniref:Uncharacterized protein n=1 Tax=Pseudocohnilembus persalinus TaxID=266149 RepID=A0A0V0QR36_PSEPJ|nr:hypothetical protein PPERSA_03115 [Pseudocohnilembus persalinus]|eukprot:KRX04724.1 hypothetical protein PPERSA_03115 [Pseudocohnilembus persalinus]